MSRLLLAVAVAAILLLVGAFVPVGGKTLVERWKVAPDVTRLAGQAWAEVTSGWDQLWGAKPAGRPAPKGSAARGQAAARQARPPGSPPDRSLPEPVEHHTDADRNALDRIVAEHAADPPAPRR
jgi:hypothetical protein